MTDRERSIRRYLGLDMRVQDPASGEALQVTVTRRAVYLTERAESEEYNGSEYVATHYPHLDRFTEVYDILMGDGLEWQAVKSWVGETGAPDSEPPVMVMDGEGPYPYEDWAEVWSS